MYLDDQRSKYSAVKCSEWLIYYNYYFNYYYTNYKLGVA